MSTECTLKCSNGGSCFVGSADFGFHAIDQHLPWTGETDVNGMYCVCSTGFTGVQCEVVFERCGKNQHPCFNGSTCKEAADGESNCDCSSATSASPVAGHFCQHEATSLCGAPAGEAQPSHSFCANGGICKDVFPTESREHPGCSCSGKWTGDHCEHLAGAAYASPASLAKSTGAAHLTASGIGAALLVGLAAIMIGGTLWIIVMPTKKRRAGENEALGNISAAHLANNMDDAFDASSFDPVPGASTRPKKKGILS